MKLARMQIVALITLLTVAASRIGSAAPLVMPMELSEYAHAQHCGPIDDFYERPGMLNPPYVYGVLPGEPEDSAAFWCKKPEASDRPYVLLLRVKNAKALGGCSDRIEWWNYPKGLSVVIEVSLNLSDFHFVAEPKRPGPATSVSDARVIMGEYDGVEERFLCYQGAWLFEVRH